MARVDLSLSGRAGPRPFDRLRAVPSQVEGRLRSGQAGVDDRQGRAPSRLLRQARVVDLRSGAPSVSRILFGHGLEVKLRSERLARRGLAQPALMDSIREGEAVDAVKKRVGTPARETWSVRSKRVRKDTGKRGTTTHAIELVCRSALRPPERHPSDLQPSHVIHRLPFGLAGRIVTRSLSHRFCPP